MWLFDIFKKKTPHPSQTEHIDDSTVIQKVPLSMCGNYSDRISWRLEGDTLILFGEGSMMSLDDIVETQALTQPWLWQHREKPVIRKVIIEKGITSVGYGAFSEHPFLETVAIADSVSSIYDSAFSGCTALKTVTIPGTIENVGALAFDGTPFLKGLRKETGLVCLGACAYLYFGTATSVNIPEGVKTLGLFLFKGNKRLETVNIPGSVVEISASAFKDCEALKSVAIPDSVKKIGPAAFENCRSLSEVRINLNVTTFDSSSFEKTPWLEDQQNSIIIGQTLIASPYKAERFEIPESAKIIARGAISDKPLLELEIPQSVEQLTESCCSSCSQLKVLRLPDNLHMFPPHICPIICCPGVEKVYYEKGSSISVQGIQSMGRAGDNAVWIRQNTGLVSVVGSGTVDLDMVIEVDEEDYADIGSYLVFRYVWGCADVEINESVTLSAPFPRTLPTESMRNEYEGFNIEDRTYHFSVRYSNRSSGKASCPPEQT